MKMAPTTLNKYTGSTGILHLLLLGLLLPAVLVSGQNSTSTPNVTTAAMTVNSTTDQPSTTMMPETSANTSNTTSAPSVATANAVIQSPTISTNAGSTGASTSQSPTATSGSATTSSTTQSPMTAANGTATTILSTNSTTYEGTTSASSTAGSTAMAQSSNITTTSGYMNGTSSNFNCPSFSCNYSDCYTMYTSQNATSCAAGCYCQLIRQMDMYYTVSCSDTCAASCVNASQTNCSEKCCNFTDCLSGNFASMMTMNATTVTATATQATTTTTTQVSSTAAINGNKCHQGVCTGTTCYTAFISAALQSCSSSQPHCQLKKETLETKLQWTAGCIANCSGQTSCTASTQPSCHLECCNATATSCLWLNGTLNVPSYATRGAHLHTGLISCLLLLLALASML